MAITQKDVELSRAVFGVIRQIMRSVCASLRAVGDSDLTAPQLHTLALVSPRRCTNKQLADRQGASE